MTPGLARAVVRNNWPWVSGRTGREAVRLTLTLPRSPLVMVQTGASVEDATTVVQFFRAPWRKTAVVVIDGRGDGSVEAAMRGEGVFCFLSGTDAEPDAIEELAAAMLAELGESVPGQGADRVAMTEERTDDQDHAGRLEGLLRRATPVDGGAQQPHHPGVDRPRAASAVRISR
jgi:hypothetical protein